MRIGRFYVVAYVLTIFAMLAIAASQAQPAPQSSAPRYKDPSLPIEDRVADLLPRMTLEEKVDLIATGWENHIQIVDPTGTFTNEQAQKIILSEWGPEAKVSPRQMAILRNGVQRYLREKSRLGIPALFYSEALHGLMEYGSTSFPQALGLASTWDPGLVKRVFSAAGDEAGSRGVGQVFTPVLDIARDPRWGRTEETYGEDPFLVSRIGVAAIEGLEGDSFLIDRHHVMATAKHFAAHGQPEGGTNTAPGNFSERMLRENFLIPFQAAVQEAHVGSVMASYNEIDGVPSHMNRWLLDKVLRQEWGFGGYIVSDDFGIQMLAFTHHVAYNASSAGRMALAAGVDYDLSDGSAYRALADEVSQGIVPVSALDKAVARVLEARFRLGLFENPYVDPDYVERTTNGEEHRKIALEAARKVLVLLKNDKDLLPLDLAKLKTIAVIGPNAADVHLGGYTRDPGRGVSVLDGIRARVGNKATVLYSEGCRITDAPQGYLGWMADNVKLIDPKTQTDSIQAAVATARKADVAILVVGENESTNREAYAEEHRGDRDSLDLLGAQNDLVKAVVETGTPTVVLLLNGRPLSINYIAEKVPAILEGWYLGQEGGTAAAEVIFGDVNPGGKLPITFPHTVGALPDYYDHKPSANRSYEFSTRQPLYAFGHGLSYTTFRFENLRVEPERIHTGGTAKISVDIVNSGKREGDEVAQLYVHPKVASVTQPVMQLKGFERITLKPGEKRTAEFTVTPELLSILDVDMHRVVEPGVFELMVGPASDETSKVLLTVTGPNGETGRPPLPAPPAGSESGVVSNFDDLKVSANFGSWMSTSDAEGGGKSTVSMRIVQPGAENTKGALQIAGELIADSQLPYASAGAIYWPGPGPMQSVNLSGRKGISFWAKGDGKEYQLTVVTEGFSGQEPPTTTFVAGPEWKHYTFPFSAFETDGSNLAGLAFTREHELGKFRFEIDELEFK
jgi:beta-glucosidase